MPYFTQTADISRVGRNFVKPFISAFGAGRTFQAAVFRVDAAGPDVAVQNASISEEGSGIYSLTVPHGEMSAQNNYYAVVSDNATGEVIRIPMWTHLSADFDDVAGRIADPAAVLDGLHGFNLTDNKATIASALKKALDYGSDIKTEIGDMTSEAWSGLGGQDQPVKPVDVAEALALIYNKEIDLEGDLSALDTLLGNVAGAEIGETGAAPYPATVAAALKAIYTRINTQAITVAGVTDGVWNELVEDHTGENAVAGSFAVLLNEAAADAETARSAAVSADTKLGTAAVASETTVAQGTVYQELGKILADTDVIGTAVAAQTNLGEETIFQALAGIRGVVDTLTAVGQAARLSLYFPESISSFRTASLAVQISLVSRDEKGADDDLELVGNGRAFLRVLGQSGGALVNRLYTDMAMTTLADAGADMAYTGYKVMTANGASNAKFSLYFKLEPKDNESFTFEAAGQDSDGNVIRKVTAVKQLTVASVRSSGQSF